MMMCSMNHTATMPAAACAAQASSCCANSANMFALLDAVIMASIIIFGLLLAVSLLSVHVVVLALVLVLGVLVWKANRVKAAE